MKIFITLNVEAIHNWEGCDLPEVKYLSHLHRHHFYIKMYFKVTHDDRDIEFLKMQHQVREYLHANYYSPLYKLMNFKGMSCEMIAKMLAEKFQKACMIEVSEDNENGAIYKRPKVKKSKKSKTS